MSELKKLFNSNNAFVFLCCKKCGKALNKYNTAMYRNKYYCKECRFEMTKNIIKFSKKYPKLWGQNQAKLIAVEDINIDENTNRDLIEYDTKALDGSYYELKKGKYIQLIYIYSHLLFRLDLFCCRSLVNPIARHFDILLDIIC